MTPRLIIWFQIALHGKEDLVESEVYPGLEDAHEQLLDVFDEMEGQLDKEVSRVAELVDKMGKDPGQDTLSTASTCLLISLS